MSEENIAIGTTATPTPTNVLDFKPLNMREKGTIDLKVDQFNVEWPVKPKLKLWPILALYAVAPVIYGIILTLDWWSKL